MIRKDKVSLINGDSFEFCKLIPDNFYDLLLCDSPYGIGMSKSAGKSKRIEDKKWDDDSPSKEFFDELIRVSKNQIIFGANHFIDKIPYRSSCWIVWDKRCGIVPPRTFADGELAWTSFERPTRIARFLWDGFLTHGKKVVRHHPTQKPVELYEWILRHYAKEGDKILDPFGGSFSSAVAASKLDYYMDAVELDQGYYQRGVRRFEEETAQTSLF